MKMLKTAAYCRVSTDKDDQKNSLESQKAYFEEYIRKNPEWELVKIYPDEHVIIGTSGENLVPFSFLLRDKPKSFKSLKIINERL